MVVAAGQCRDMRCLRGLRLRYSVRLQLLVKNVVGWVILSDLEDCRSVRVWQKLLVVLLLDELIKIILVVFEHNCGFRQLETDVLDMHLIQVRLGLRDPDYQISR